MWPAGGWLTSPLTACRFLPRLLDADADGLVEL